MERTITLIWDYESNVWRDKHSNQEIAVIPPAMTLEPVAPSQPNDDEPDSLTRDVVREIARNEATHVLAAAMIPKYPAYFMNGHWLVTYEWAKALADAAEQRAVETATWQIKRSFPRWLRWLIR